MAELAAEKPLELPGRHAGLACQFRQGGRLIKRLLHKQNCPDEPLVRQVEPPLHRHPLSFCGRSDARVQQQFSRFGRAVLAVVLADQGEDQIKHGRPAGAGQPIPVDTEEIAGERHGGKTAGEFAEELPMRRAAIPVEQPRLRGEDRARTERTDSAPDPGLLTQPGRGALVIEFRGRPV